MWASLRVGRKTPKCVWRNNEIKAAVRRKEAVYKEVLAAVVEEAKERCMEVCREEKRNVKRSIYQRKKKVNEQFGRKMKEDVNGNRKLFWKVINVKGGKVESYGIIKDGNGRLSQGEDEVRRIYFEDLYNIDSQEEVTVHMCFL